MVRTFSLGVCTLLAAISLACGDDGGGGNGDALPDLTSTVGVTSTPAMTPTATPTRQATPAGPVPTAGTARTSVQAELREFSIGATPASAPSGTVTFQVRNSGTIQHDFIVIRTERASGDLPRTADGSAADLSGLDVRLEIPAIDGGRTVNEDEALPPGSYALICNLPAHYPAGMHTGFTVN